MNKKITLFILFVVVATTAMAQHTVVQVRSLTNLKDSALFARRIDSVKAAISGLAVGGGGIVDLSAYYTKTETNAAFAPASHVHTFASLSARPTTIAGYGITDAYPLSGNPSGFLTPSDIAGKQNTITLTTNFTSGAATFNAATGALNIPNYATGGGGGGATPLTDNLTTSTTGTALDAHQGFVLKGLIDANTTTIGGKLTASSNLSDLASATTARTNLGLGTLATQSGTFSGTSSGTNTGDETVTTIKTKLGITTLSGANTGDETTTRINALYGYTPANPANFQPLENQRLSTTNLPQFTAINILPQASLSTPVSGFDLADSTGAGATFIFPSGVRKSLNWSNVTGNGVWKFQNKSYTLADSADVAGKQGVLTLTTNFTSGAATLTGNILNIPNYATGGGGSTTLTDNLTTSTTGTALDAHQGFVLKGLIDGHTTSIAGKESAIAAGTTAQYWRGDKTWQTLNSAAVGLGSVENTALSTWAGSSNITTAGTITTGTWNATAIGVTKGGSGLTSAVLGDIHYGSAANTLAALAGNTTATKKFLTQTGTGTVSAAPAWNTIVAGDIPDISASYATQTQLTTTNTAVSGKQPQLSGTGFVKASGTTISYDNSTYLTANQSITLSGDISGTGTTAITTAIGASKVTNTMLAGSITAAKLVGSDITLTESQITSLTTDLAAKVSSTTDNQLAVSSGVITTRKTFATATDAATTTLNCATGMNWWWTIGGNRTLAFSNQQDGDIITLYVVQDATGSRTVTWPTGTVWINGSAPTLKTAGTSIDRVTFQYRSSNTTWYASY